MLMSLEERLKVFSELGLDNCLLLDFTSELMNMTPETFLKALVGLNLRMLIVGHDFRFGKDASGDTRYLLDFLNRRGLRGEVIPPVKVKGEIVCSSRIRELLLSGYLEEANHMLGRAFSVSGLVAPGAHRGRKMGFPTANLQVAPNRLLPKYGVYLAHSIIDSQEYYGLSNVGIKPTFSGESPLIEAHFFDADLDLYQREISVSFLRFLRAERKFSSPTELLAQMKLDEERGRKYLAELKNRAKTDRLFG